MNFLFSFFAFVVRVPLILLHSHSLRPSHILIYHFIKGLRGFARMLLHRNLGDEGSGVGLGEKVNVVLFILFLKEKNVKSFA